MDWLVKSDLTAISRHYDTVEGTPATRIGVNLKFLSVLRPLVYEVWFGAI
jgi:hypothetical protein